MLKNEDIDFTISGSKFLLRKRIFKILEIDIDDSYKEVTLLDIEVGIPCIVDLTYSQAEYIKETKLMNQQYIIASYISIIGDSGLSGEWQL
ncbi:hypothetical protein [Erysipelothrix rhusiopathiae]|uniref:Uncharacterized protein n=1 Tax=Erysipelothrix rhusiopathiae ATCC 19414 TaxID=525280 RepID=E7FVR8_ERYRH|nr:hypothetical protein [Erysipelothrix rhusiopathiae]EFY08988.1 hypothetical protein HMPREF0357_11095 [Erysipelothrix rhusiopathiae ATCC 19414]VEH83479.1 Uncharacterised protein [Erysipelothrix rhusiopathiae]